MPMPAGSPHPPSARNARSDLLAAIKAPLRIELSKLPLARLEDMESAALAILECYRVLNKSGANVVGEVLKGQGKFLQWDHYPAGDVYDWESHSQYYYHAHPPSKRVNLWGAEHGHFHTFQRPKGMPKGTRPAKVADFRKPDDPNDALSHIIALSMDGHGRPTRLFTTNRWVTGEIWYDAATVISFLDRFSIDQASPSWPANIWISCMLRLFRPQIEALLHRRDRIVSACRPARRDADYSVFEDRNLEVTSITDIAVDRQIRNLKKVLAAKRRRPRKV